MGLGVTLVNSASAQESYVEKPGSEGNGDVVIGPDYKLDVDLTDRGNPKGKQFEFSMRLADSKIFRGDDATLEPKKKVREQRKIFVYIPAAYKDGTKAPILVTLDGPSLLNLVRNAVDNLTVSKDPKRALPPFIVISVENGGDDSKGSERGLEYDTMSDRFARFINDEVLPAVLNHAEIKAAYPHIAFTKNPWGKGVMGCSSGGAAALTMGWFRPDLFRRLITYSGTFVDQQDDNAPEEAQYPLGAWEYHSGKKLIENSEKKPLRIFTHVSENDNGAKDPEETYHNWVMANQRTAAALKAKGYEYRYVFSRASRHCDGNVFEQTLADTLVWMWRGYQADATPTAALLKTFVDEFVSIEPGQSQFPAVFEMGDDVGDSSEKPQHRVTMSGPFAMAKYEVPQNLYEAIMGSNPSRWKGPRNSVEMMSWEDANEFCRKITARLRAEQLIAGDEVIRLPTEAEWEYCCRAGTQTRYHFGDEAQKDGEKSPKASMLNVYGWHTGNAAGNDPPVGALKPNAWGLYDFHGYLWEFTADAWSDNYKQAPADSRAVKVSDETKSIVVRGGSWKDSFEKLTSASRRPLLRTGLDDAVGFRCVKSK